MIEYELPNATWANVDLVGEYHRQGTITALIGGRPKAGDSKQIDVRVHLVPEPDNPYSPTGHAISARIEDKVVGYLSNGDAEKWFLEIHRIAASGAVAATTANVLAYNRTKWDNNGRTRWELEINIRVALPDPGLVVPLNVQLPNDAAILPWGSALQVTGEDRHLQHLFEYVPASGQGLVVLTMHRIENTLKNGTIKELVEVRLDGERVGQLTPASSQHFLPIIAHAKDMGKTLAVWSRLKGSALAVELTVQGARATELQDEWMRTMPALPALVPEASVYDVPDAYTPDTGRGSAKSSKTRIREALEAGKVVTIDRRYASADTRKDLAPAAAASALPVAEVRSEPQPVVPPAAPRIPLIPAHANDPVPAPATVVPPAPAVHSRMAYPAAAQPPAHAVKRRSPARRGLLLTLAIALFVGTAFWLLMLIASIAIGQGVGAAIFFVVTATLFGGGGVLLLRAARRR